jgi:hypothetical protein
MHMFCEWRATKNVPWETLMRITKHEKSYIVELSDRSAWRIWPADMADTLQWLPTTEIKIKEIDDEACSHALINQSDGSRAGDRGVQNMAPGRGPTVTQLLIESLRAA